MKPRIVITTGDPAGVGPEIVAACMRDAEVLSWCDPVVIGDPVAFNLHGLPLPKVEMLPAPGLPKNLKLGEPSKEAGVSALESLSEAFGLIQLRQAVAMVTAPVSKQSLDLAGANLPGRQAGVPGHTEWLAQQSKSPSVAMLMVARKLRTILLTRHVPLSKVASTLTSKVIQEGAVLGHAFVKQILKKSKPRLAMCGVNPHAGDNGLIGKEEGKTITPALKALAKRGILIYGPGDASSVFRDMAKGAYDLVLAAYHDQGMIPLKLHAQDEMVNITLGLPFIRTSPAHGTAFDIAGKGVANYKPMKEAIRLAAKYSLTHRPETGRSPLSQRERAQTPVPSPIRIGWPKAG